MLNTLFIAEVSSNHHRDLDRCLRFIDTAANIGCDGVKFQLFKIDKLFAPEVLARSEKHRKRRDWELPVAFLPHLARRCHDRNMAFSCTPFYLEAVDELRPYVDFYKIASYELLWDDLLITCARTGKPVVLSTGMAAMDEIEHAVNIILKASSQAFGPGLRVSDYGFRASALSPLTLLHCVSSYPVPPDQCNLAAIQTLRNAFARVAAVNSPNSVCGPPAAVHIGWSDHSVHPQVIKRAVHKWKASMIEFHLDLDGRGEEFETGHCWLPDQVQEVISQIRSSLTPPESPVSDLSRKMDGSCLKMPTPAELKERDWRADPSDGLRPLLEARRPGDEQDG